MGCWGATRDCFRNCCGGPHSEHYDSWMSRERMRQNNALTQRNEALVRKNAQLELALTQTQDVLSSYRDLDQFDAGGQQVDERSMSMTSLVRADSQALGSRRSQSGGRRASLGLADQRQASMGLDSSPQPPARPVPPRVREMSPQHRSARQIQPAPSRMSARPADDLSFVVPAQAPKPRPQPTGPLMSTAPTMYDDKGGKVSARQEIPLPAKSLEHEQRRVQRRELAATMAALPDFTGGRVRSSASSPFGAPAAQSRESSMDERRPDAHGSTHGYAPAPMRGASATVVAGAAR